MRENYHIPSIKTEEEKVCPERDTQSPWNRFWLNSSGPCWLIRPNCLSVCIKTPEKAVSLPGSQWRVLFLGASLDIPWLSKR